MTILNNNMAIYLFIYLLIYLSNKSFQLNRFTEMQQIYIHKNEPD